MVLTRCRHGGHDVLASTSSARAPLVTSVLATAENVSELRSELQRWLSIDVAVERAEDLVLAAYEAMANTAEHAYATDAMPGNVHFAAHRTTDRVYICVCDDGVWDDSPSEPFRGRGLEMMRTLSDLVRIGRTPEGTCVELLARTT